jgi:hypothetical protein
MPSNDPISNIQAKRQQQAQSATEEARNQSIVNAVKTSGQDTKDSLTKSMHDILLATMVGKDPRIVEVATNLSELLESIAAASDKVKESSLKETKVAVNLKELLKHIAIASDEIKSGSLKEVKSTFKELTSELSSLPDKVAATDQSRDLIPFIQGVEKAVRGIRVNPSVTVKGQEQNLKPVTDLLKNIEKSIKDNKVKIDIPKQDDEDVINAIRGTTKAINSLSFPVPNYVLPFKNNQGAATQANVVTSSGDSTKIGIIALNPDGSNISGSALPAGTNNIGQVSVAPQTANGLSVFNGTSSDGATALTSTAQVIKASAGQVYGWYIYNPNATAQFVQLYNTAAASVTVGTTNPLFMLTIPATSAANVEFTNGITFSNAGFSCAATSTAGGNGAPSTALDAVIYYK